MSIFLSQKQAREFLNITQTTILRWEEQGQFEYNYLKTFCKSHGVEIINNEQQKKN